MNPLHESRNSAKRFWGISALALATLQCTLVVDADRKQCTQDRDCQARGTAFAKSICQDSVCIVPPAWACLQTDDNDDATSNGSDSVTVKVPLISVLTLEPVSGVEAQICSKIDSECLAPLSDTVVSDNEGVLTFRVKSGFDGFLTLTHEDFGTSLYFVNPAITQDQTVATIRLASIEMATILLQQVGKPFDPSRGFVVLTAEDCLAQSAEGVTFSLSVADGESQTFYSVGSLPTTSTTATDASGYGGFIGIPPGNKTILGNLQDNEEMGQVTLFVKAGTVTYSRMVPNAQR